MIWQLDEYYFYETDLLPDIPTVVEIGCFSLDCARVILARWPRVHYIAVEPSSANYTTLLTAIAVEPRVSRNDPGVEPYRIALSDHDGPIPFYDFGHEQWASAFPRHETEGKPLIGTETVSGLTLRSLLDRCQVKTCDLLLLNAEGAEIHAMRQLADDAELRARVPQFCTSFHCDHVTIYPPSRRDALVKTLSRWYDIQRGTFEPIPYYLFRRKERYAPL